jgi:hypothetical protein
MESLFRRDFGNVRIYAGQEAARSARALNSAAYCSGNNIFFGAGQFMPWRGTGKGLLAHELTHVVQAANGALSDRPSPNSVDELEHEAQRVSAAIDHGRLPPPVRGVASTGMYPLKAPPGPTDPDAPTFGNLPGDVPLPGSGFKRVELKKVDDVWYEVSPRAPMSRASGNYDFVVQDGRIWAVKSKGPFGHTEAAGGGRVAYAGQVKFGGPGGRRGVVTEWSNASGHYAPVSAFKENAVKAGLPEDKFVPIKGEKPEQGPQLPVAQPRPGHVKPPTPEVKPPTPEFKPPTPEFKPPTVEVKPPTPEVTPPAPEMPTAIRGGIARGVLTALAEQAILIVINLAAQWALAKLFQMGLAEDINNILKPQVTDKLNQLQPKLEQLQGSKKVFARITYDFTYQRDNPANDPVREFLQGAPAFYEPGSLKLINVHPGNEELDFGPSHTDNVIWDALGRQRVTTRASFSLLIDDPHK